MNRKSVRGGTGRPEREGADSRTHAAKNVSKHAMIESRNRPIRDHRLSRFSLISSLFARSQNFKAGRGIAGCRPARGQDKHPCLSLPSGRDQLLRRRKRIRQRPSFICASSEAGYDRIPALGRRTQVAKGEVCKTFIQRFESARRLQFPLSGAIFWCRAIVEVSTRCLSPLPCS